MAARNLAMVEVRVQIPYSVFGGRGSSNLPYRIV